MLFLFYPFYHRLLKLSSSFLSFQIAIIKRTITIEESFEVGLDDGQDTSDDDFKKEDWEIPSGQNSLGICTVDNTSMNPSFFGKKHLLIFSSSI